MSNNQIIVKEIDINKNKITYKYDISGQWKKYFREKAEFRIIYEEDITNVPKSICVIPLIANILPISWYFDATISLDEIDKGFYDSISEFKEGYMKMYPHLEFKGKIEVKNVIDNSYNTSEKVGMFYSGGVDATSTLVSHIDEKPILINLQGSDIDIKNTKTINEVEKNFRKTVEKLGLKITFVNTTFRKLIRIKKFDLINKSKVKDNYWHGFQHGIGIISHAAPIAYKYKLNKIYIASSFTEEYKSTCASDPTIDNFVKLASTIIVHDGYEFNRGNKINNICGYVGKSNKNISLRVCFNDQIPHNCEECEKCYRTIFQIIANGYNPKDFGFRMEYDFFKKAKIKFEREILVEHSKFWKDIQNSIKVNKDKIKDYKELEWILTYDFDTCNKHIIKYIIKIKKAIIKRFRRYILKEMV